MQRCLGVLVLFLMFAACGHEGEAPSVRRTVRKDEGLVEHNRRANEREQRDIGNYLRRHGISTVVSGTGVHLRMLRDMPGDTVRPEQWVSVNYRIELLDGTFCYGSGPGAPESFKVEHDLVESGLHEAVQHLSPGDSALIIIPSYRAHGLVGDMEKIPMRSTVVYHLGLVAIADRG